MDDKVLKMCWNYHLERECLIDFEARTGQLFRLKIAITVYLDKVMLFKTNTLIIFID